MKDNQSFITHSQQYLQYLTELKQTIAAVNAAAGQRADDTLLYCYHVMLFYDCLHDSMHSKPLCLYFG